MDTAEPLASAYGGDDRSLTLAVLMAAAEPLASAYGMRDRSLTLAVLMVVAEPLASAYGRDDSFLARQCDRLSRRAVCVTSQTMQNFFATHTERLTKFQLPAYSPNSNPIEFLWKKVKKPATHLKCFPTARPSAYAVAKVVSPSWVHKAGTPLQHDPAERGILTNTMTAAQLRTAAQGSSHAAPIRLVTVQVAPSPVNAFRRAGTSSARR